MGNETYQFKTGDTVRVIKGGGEHTARHHLMKGVKVIVLAPADDRGHILVQASGVSDFYGFFIGWGDDSIGKHLQYVKASDIELAYPRIESLKTLHSNALPLI